jgi:hypothetical protein
VSETSTTIETTTTTKTSKRGDEFSREKYFGLLRAGLWPTTALAYLGVSRREWRTLVDADATLAVETARAVAAFELIHVRNLHTKIQEANDWRGSAWWLAQRFPKRYGSGRGGQEAAKAVESVLATIDESLRAEFNTPGDMERVGKVFSRLGKGKDA